MSSKLLLAEIPSNLIARGIGDDQGLDTQGLIYDHLVHYCSKFPTLPAIEVVVDSERIRVTRRGIYLKIAKDLGRSSLRVVISPQSNERAVNLRIKSGHIKLLDYELVRTSEQAVENGWHVFFFEDELDDKQLADFKTLLRAAFEARRQTPNSKQKDLGEFSYLASKRCVEFQALTPVEDHAFANDFLRRLIEFNNQIAKIVSYQGRRFLAPSRDSEQGGD